jgi:IS30 family transposase
MPHLKYKKRVRIQCMLQDNEERMSQKYIANKVWVSEWTISNELRWFKQKWVPYDAEIAQQRTKEKRVQANKKVHTREIVWTKLEKYITKKIKRYLSPEQIANTWNEENSDDKVWHGIIYQYIYEYHPERKKKYLRRKGKKYKAWNRDKTKIPNRVGIENRPKEVEEKLRLWDYEWDTIVWSNKWDCIITIVDRRTTYLFARVVHLNRWELLSVVVSTMMWEIIRWVREELRQTLTLDNGTEFADWEYVKEMTWIEVYFANPYSSRERGCNENTNGLLRQFLPKWMSFKNVTQEELDSYVDLINMRPRKKLDRKSPADVFLA